MANSKKGSQDPRVYYQFRLDLTDEKELIIEAEKASGGVQLRLDSDSGDFSFVISDEALKKLGVCILRYLKGQGGCFYHDKFYVGGGPEQKEFPVIEILGQYPL